MKRRNNAKTEVKKKEKERKKKVRKDIREITDQEHKALMT